MKESLQFDKSILNSKNKKKYKNSRLKYKKNEVDEYGMINPID
jgi:hypothetical protein